VHSGSRAIGPAIRDHYLACATYSSQGLHALEADGEDGAGYRSDVEYARAFAESSRIAMALAAGEALAAVLGARLCWETRISTDHNHVAAEQHEGRTLWVHRKGAMPAGSGVCGVLPGSMGSASYHVEGRGHPDALCSSAHGAGRALSRTAAHGKVTARELRRQMQGVWFDFRLAERLRDEAPGAYKDITAVVRAQHPLVRVTRVLRPVLNYKGV
jgi:tRNA-splicing ligase RtcB